MISALTRTASAKAVTCSLDGLHYCHDGQRFVPFVSLQSFSILPRNPIEPNSYSLCHPHFLKASLGFVYIRESTKKEAMTEVFPQNDPPNNHEIAPTLQQVFIKYTMESAIPFTSFGSSRCNFCHRLNVIAPFSIDSTIMV